MDFMLSPELAALRTEVRQIIEEHVIPNEDAVLKSYARGDHAPLESLRAHVRSKGLWTPHLPESFGGRGLGVMGMCALFREMGRSFAGASAFGCDAPDQGNMDLLLKAASPAIQDRYLRPLCDGAITSAFAMTEPAPGAGSDPSNLRTTATQDGDHWVLRGHKWYTTGGRDAAFLILMARTGEGRSGATLFVVDRHAEGVEYVRDIPVMSPPVLHHVEGEFRFHDVRVHNDAVLGGVGQGFPLAQTRLVPARLTHCMRWLGLADRALQICRTYVNERVSFGQVLARHQAVQAMLARSATAIHSGNLMTLHCASMLERGEDARVYSSMAKHEVARALCQILDDAIQMHGGLGYSDDVPFAQWYRAARAARIADGPDEVHQMVVARAVAKGTLDTLV